MKYRTKIGNSSGTYPIPLFTKPYKCGGECIFCPNEAGIPKSYISNEDTLFANSCSYSSRSQFARLIRRISKSSLRHSVPCELIILGGSFSALEKDYRLQFLADVYSFMSLNDCDNENQRHWETGRYRPSIVTVESRPDQIDIEECRLLRRLGVSKVELGVQHTSDYILNLNCRGHDQAAVIRATNILKDEGFKVGYHIMLGLPFAEFVDDYRMLTETLWRSEYSPDYLKIYPCILLKNPSFQPKLFRLYYSGEWFPPNENDIVALFKALSRVIPSYVRLSRIQRQFNSCDMVSGLKPGLRSRVGVNFNDLRSREIGRVFPATNVDRLGPTKTLITSIGRDYIIEFRCKENAIAGIARVRLREPGVMVLRELRVYGDAAPIGLPGPVQGHGLGSRLLCVVEQLAAELSVHTLLVNASFGARPFFRKNGYIDTNHDLVKKELPFERYAFSINKQQMNESCEFVPLAKNTSRADLIP